MTFSGWPEEALDFYDGLTADNSKTWWTAHKAIYTDKVLRPMTELAEELAAEFGEPKIFRPYRDVRFSADKTPYKTHIGAVVGGTGYIQLSAEGLGVGAGMWQMNPEQLARYRRPRARRAQVRPTRLPGRPPPHHAAPLQGPDRVETMAGGTLAGKCRG